MATEKPRFAAIEIGVGEGSFKVKAGLFHSKLIDQSSALLVDTEALCVKLVKVYTELDDAGYDVINVLPINSGVVAEVDKNVDGLLSVTRGAIVIGRLRADEVTIDR